MPKKKQQIITAEGEGTFIPMIAGKQIAVRLDALAAVIEEHYRGKELDCFAIMAGALFFASDLLQRISLPLRLFCAQASSYDGGMVSTGRVRLGRAGWPEKFAEEVLVLDDILDTGLTLDRLARAIREHSPESTVRTAVLLRKNRERTVDIDADWSGFEIDDRFVVGYGLDYEGRHRNLTDIYEFQPRGSEA